MVILLKGLPLFKFSGACKNCFAFVSRVCVDFLEDVVHLDRLEKRFGVLEG